MAFIVCGLESYILCIDVDECNIPSNNCGTNALCTNTPGSFTCTCNHGYTGDGVTCTGIYYSYLKDFTFNGIIIRC